MGSIGRHWSHTVHRAWSRTQRLSRDSWRLLVAFWKAPGSSAPQRQVLAAVRPPPNRREVLLQQARENDNEAARTLLLWEREVNLLCYYGPSGYLREKKLLVGSLSASSIVSRFLPSTQRLASTFAATGSGDSSSNNDCAASSSTAATHETNNEGPATTSSQSDGSDRVVAKIPFMITARMRQDLLELGYEPSQIACLIPVHAMLILENSVPPEKMKLDLPELIKAYEAERQRAAEHAAAERKKQQEILLLEQQRMEAAEAIKETEQLPQTRATSATSTSLPLKSPEPSSDLAVPQPTELSTAGSVLAPFAAEPAAVVEGTTWHQVIEISPNNSEDTNTSSSSSSKTPSTNVVGMFLDRKEAEFARGVHQDLANERTVAHQKNANNNQTPTKSTSTFEIRTIVKE